MRSSKIHYRSSHIIQIMLHNKFKAEIEIRPRFAHLFQNQLCAELKDCGLDVKAL